MEKAEEIGRNSAVDSKDIEQQSKAFDNLVDRVKDLQLDSTLVPSAMGSIAASKEADDAKSMSDGKGEDSYRSKEWHEIIEELKRLDEHFHEEVVKKLDEYIHEIEWRDR